MVKVRDSRGFHDGFQDGLEPVRAIDLQKAKTVDDIIRQMASSSFGARAMGEAADILEEMISDKSCYKILTISGAMTMAKLGLVFGEIIERGWVDAVVATGALIAHGYIESEGMTHFKCKSGMNDTQLYELGYDRVYDTLETEKNFLEASQQIAKIFGAEYHDKMMGSWEICEIIGRHLDETGKGRSILRSAYERQVPVYIPALNDSELGLDLISMQYASRLDNAREAIHIKHDAFFDVTDFARRVAGQERLGIFTIGGGVPRNWAQQVAPFLELKYFLTNPNRKFPCYDYGVRICPEPAHWGGLSGCTYSEGVSWGKFNPEGRFAEVYADATVVLPFLIKALMERLDP